MQYTEEDTIDLLELAKAIWKNILIIALVAVLLGSAAFGVSAFVMEPTSRPQPPCTSTTAPSA